MRTRMRLLSAVVTGAAVAVTAASATSATANTKLSAKSAPIAQALNREGAVVNLFWPVNSNFAAFVQNVLKPGFEAYTKKTYGIKVTLNVLDASGGDTAFLTKLEANAGQSGFDIDVARTAPSARLITDLGNGLLTPLNSHSTVFPNLAYVDASGKKVFQEGKLVYGAPIYRPTMSLFYNADLVKDPPTSLAGLLAYCKANPGKVSYEDPRSTTGTGSGQMFLLAVLHKFGDVTNPSSWSSGWDYLKSLQSCVQPEPATGDQLVDMFQRGAVTVMPYWNDAGLYAKATLKITDMKNLLMKDPFPIRYTPYVIPKAAAHPTGALVLTNYVLGPYIQARLAAVMHQIPSIDPKLVKGKPGWTHWKFVSSIFGFPLPQIQADTFPAYNSVTALNAITTMTQQYGPEVLGR
jgi:putative spermidine/putrescine transport system substrate-binding protein